MSTVEQDPTRQAQQDAAAPKPGKPADEPIIEATPDAGATGTTGQVIGRLVGYMWSVGPATAIAAMGLRLLATVALVFSPYFLGQAINELTAENGDTSTLWRNAIIAMTAGLVAAGLGAWADVLLAKLATSGLTAFQRHMFSTMQALSLDFFDRNPVGELVSRVTNDSDQVARFYEDVVARLVRSAFVIVLVLIAMFVQSVPLTVAAILVIPLMLGATAIVNKLAGPAFTLMAERLGELSGLQEETIAGHKPIIASRRQEWAGDIHEQEAQGVYDTATRAWFTSVVQIPLSYVFTVIQVVVVAFVGGLLVVAGELELGVVVAFMSYVALLASPITELAQQTAQALSAAASGRRVFQIIDSEPTVRDAPDAAQFEFGGGHVQFDDVDFSYIPGRKILRGNTFEALPGEKIGLVGPTGAGKSTIINILTRYYDIDSGTILIDGQKLTSVTQESLRTTIGVVLQEAFLFSDTVMNNLLYARKGATREECIEAAKRANAHEFILRLPDEYDTMLTERGANLSQGQRQMLTIARAMVADPQMLILDEATSNVDTRTEALIQQGLNRLMEGRTSFVIAHRLSTIQDSSKILVLNGGAIEEIGNHEELLESKGLYYALYMSQFKGKGPGGDDVGDVDFVST